MVSSNRIFVGESVRLQIPKYFPVQRLKRQNMADHSSKEKSHSIEAINQDGVGLFVGFTWHKDRFGHVISLVQGDELTPLFVSIEGGYDPEWPTSPPLQDASVEQRGARQMALLVGQAGDSHWSVSADADPGDVSVTFDVACRMKEHPSAICSRYACLLDNKSMPDFDRDKIWWKYQVKGVCVAVERLLYDQFPPTEMPATEQGFEVNACVDQEPFPKTIQWSYRVFLSND